jgi:hypothetical protein
VNGVNREQLFGTLDRIKGTPGLGKFRFKIHNEWLNGAHTRSTVHSFSGAGANLEHAVQFELDADEPAILFGSDQAVNRGSICCMPWRPVCHVVHGLSCGGKRQCH